MENTASTAKKAHTRKIIFMISSAIAFVFLFSIIENELLICISISLLTAYSPMSKMLTIQSHAKLRSANACIQADKQFYMAK